MNRQIQKTRRNQAIECCRLAAAVGVVFIHILFPGQLGSAVHCLARIAVPFFFVVSGYFAWGAEEGKIKKRAVDTLKLYAAAVVLSLLWGMLREGILKGAPIVPWLLETFTVRNLALWFVVNADFIGGGHLWYLTSLLVCYLVLYLYVRWNGGKYQFLYVFGGVLLALQIVLNSYTIAVGLSVSNLLYRNALLLGLPLFTLGIFLREHGSRLRETFALTNKKLVLLFGLGVVLSVLQWVAFGEIELPIGAVLEVFALMLLLVSAPSLAKEHTVPARMIAHFGSLSTFVYITHLIWGELYMLYGHELVAGRLGAGALYARPVIVVAITLVMGIVWEAVKTAAAVPFSKGKR